MPIEFMSGGLLFEKVDDAGNDIIRSAGDYDSAPIVQPRTAAGVAITITTDVDLTMQLFEEIEDVFEGPLLSQVIVALDSPVQVTVKPIKFGRYKVRHVLTGDTIFNSKAQAAY